MHTRTGLVSVILVSYEDTAAQSALRAVQVLWTASHCEHRALSGL